VLGDEFSKANQKVEDMRLLAGNLLSSFSNMRREGKASVEALNKAEDEAKKAQNELALAYLERKKLARDTIYDIATQEKAMNVATLRDSGKLVEAVKLESIEKLKAFDEQIEKLKKIKTLRKDEQSLVTKTRGAIEAANKAAEDKAAAEEKKKAQKVLPALFSEDQIKAIGDVFGEGAGAIASSASAFMAPVLGFAGAANIILDAAQQLIDLIPGLLDKVAGVFNSFTELPTKLAESFDGVVKSIINMVANFFPNLLKMIPSVLSSIIDGLLGALPDALLELAVMLPDMIIRVLTEDLPGLVTRFVTNLIMALPKIMAALIRFFLIGIPKIALEFVKWVALKLPFAILEGIMNAIKGISMDSLFGDISMDPKVGEKLEAMGDKLSRSASKLFEVIDLNAEARGLDIADRMGNIIDDMVNKMKNLLQWLLDRMNMFGKWLGELWDKFTTALKDAWSWVWKNIIQPILDGILAVWQGVIELFKLAIDALKVVWQWVYDKVLTPAWEALKSTWGWIKKNILDPITDVGKKIWEGFKAGITEGFDFFKDLGGKIWDGLKKGLGGFGKIITDALDLINPINLFKKIFDTSDALGKGTVEKALNIDVPFISFAQGGVVAGKAVVAGDSLMNDRILAMLSPGEAVIPRSVMQDPTLSKIVGMLLAQKGNIPQFAGGTLGKIAKGDLSGAVGDIGGGISDAGKGLIEGVGGALGGIFGGLLGPLWEKVKDKVFGELIWKMLEKNAFHTGGLVPAFAGGGEVPILAEAGEFVVSRRGVAANGMDFLNGVNNGKAESGGNVTIEKIEIHAKTNLTPESIRTEIVPVLIKAIKRESQDGRYIISSAGVR
jgi:hypothetical protein